MRTTCRMRLAGLAILRSGLLAILCILSSHLALFDQSPMILATESQNSPLLFLLRWDIFHFTQIALKGYVFEHQWAFLPGNPLMRRFVAYIVRWFSSDISPLVAMLSSGVLSGMTDILSLLTLYDLTTLYTASPSTAELVATLSLLSPSPVVLQFAGYPETMFTLFSYRGMMHHARQQWFFAALHFSLASMFRSNGVLLAGYLMWSLVVQPVLLEKRLHIAELLKCMLYTSIVVLPFVAHEYHGWRAFCLEAESPEWCKSPIPRIYGHVQAKYWDVGPFHYWTPNQIPNFLLPSPIIALIFCFTYVILRDIWNGSLGLRPQRPRLDKLRSWAVVPHALHAVFLTTWITFAAHVQILLRVAPSMPFLYWASAHLVINHPRLGKYWVYWLVIWGTVSTVCWAVFLPPA